jgi:AraC-like DNA-binding protein
MRGSVTSTFSEPEEFQAAMSRNGINGSVFTGIGRFRARLTEVKLNHLRLVSVQESLPWIAFMRVPSETMLVGLSVEHIRSPAWGGIRVNSGELITLGPGQSAHMRIEGPCHWGAVWLPVQKFSHYSSALTGSAREIPSGICCWRTPSKMGIQLRSLFLAAIRATLARSVPATGAEAAHALEQQLIHLLIECLPSGSASEAGRAMQWVSNVMAEFEELLRSHPEGNLRMPHISAALGVSERFLRICCEIHLGMSPMSYIRLHRMQLARYALRQGTPSTVHVADVAKRFGFGNFGRFAGAYRELYGELPFDTLRRGSLRGIPDIASQKHWRQPS